MSMTKCPNSRAKLIKISKDSYSCTNCGSLFTNGHEFSRRSKNKYSWSYCNGGTSCSFGLNSFYGGDYLQQLYQ